MKKSKLNLCNLGANLLIVFVVLLPIATIYGIVHLVLALAMGGDIWERLEIWGLSILSVVIIMSIIFLIGIALVYLNSVQLRIKYRVLGVLCGWIPVVNIIVLIIIINIVKKEVKFEKSKIALNESRAGYQICATKYPILMVHGVFFRDFEHFNYWGRIPEELEKNGARIFYGNHNSAASVENSARELEYRIRQILAETGAQKVNVIAHSKGGLDTRAAISLCGMGPYIASLTTINTPHRGCEFADYLLNIIPEKQQLAVHNAYNYAAQKLGDVNPDFLAAVYDLTHERCAVFNQRVMDSPDVFYQSFGSRQNFAVSGQFPLNFTYMFVKNFDGPNDGLVGEESFPWGSGYKLITAPGRRGISHGDVIDLNKENIPGYDVREFYVGLVADLKNRGF